MKDNLKFGKVFRENLTPRKKCFLDIFILLGEKGDLAVV